MDWAISVSNLVKDYRIYSSPFELLKEVVSFRPRHTSVRSLDSVSFNVAKGEVVGVIGRNGAGSGKRIRRRRRRP